MTPTHVSTVVTTHQNFPNSKTDSKVENSAHEDMYINMENHL